MKPLIKLWIIPALLLLMGSAMALKMYPLYSGWDHYNSDPAYAYLFNGLLLLDRHSPTHIDHPGTPVQMLIAVLVYLQWFYLKLVGTVNPDVVVAVMGAPEQYLLFISRVLLALNVGAVFFIGKTIYSQTKSVYLAIFCQCSLLTYGIFGPKLLFPAPEPLVAFFSLIFLATLSPLIFKCDTSAKEQTRIALLAGAIYGIGVAVKLSFLPMAGLLLLIKGPRNLAIAAVAVIGAWLLSVLPIIKKLAMLWSWAFNIVIHTDKYGAGKVGFINTAEIAVNLKKLLEAFPFFYFSVVLFVGYLICISVQALWRRTRDAKTTTPFERHVAKVISIFLLVCVAQTLIVVKHFGHHYMFPALPIAFVGTSLLMLWLIERRPATALPVKSFFAIAITTLIIYSTYSAFTVLKQQRVQRNHSVNQIQKELAKYQNALILTSYGCYLPQCALMYGIETAPGLDKKIPPFLVNYWGFNVWANMFVIDGHGFYPLSIIEPQFASKRPIFLVTYIDGFPAYDALQKELILTAGDQKLYRVTGLTSPK